MPTPGRLTAGGATGDRIRKAETKKPPAFAGGSYLIVPKKLLLRCTPVKREKKMGKGFHLTGYERGIFGFVNAIKTFAELATLCGLFLFLGESYESVPALAFGSVLMVCLFMHTATCIYTVAFNSVPTTSKRYLLLLIAAAILAWGVIMATRAYVISPLLDAVTKQLSATPPQPSPPTCPARAGTQAQPAQDSAARTPPSDQKPPAADPPAPSAPPSDDQNRSNTPGARKPS